MEKDIEDIDDDLRDDDSYKHTTEIIPRSGKGSKPSHDPTGIIPGAQTVFLQTFGCSHNNSDGEYMAGQLASSGYRLTSDFSSADVFVINSCTVKDPSERHFVSLLNKAKATKKPCVVAGCVPSADPSMMSSWDGVSVIGVNDIDRVVEVVHEAAQGNVVNTLKPTASKQQQKKKLGDLADIHLPKIRRNQLIEIVPINRGCLNKCTYCKTKHARGDLKSWPVAEIVSRIDHVIRNEGVKEIRITSEDTGAYGRDIGTNIVELLNAVVKVIPDGCMLRIGMTNPPYVMDHMTDIAKILNHPNVYAFIHIPVQSGSDSILSLMKREYTRDEFRRLARYLVENVPDISIATDVICGFPGETDENFRDTLDIVQEFKFPSLFISQFYPRPGTPASAMKQLPSQIIKERSRQVTDLFNSYTTTKHLLGTVQRVWITEIASDNVRWIGHTKGYVQVLLEPEDCKLHGVTMGGNTHVQITAVEKFFARGTIVAKKDNKRRNDVVVSSTSSGFMKTSWIVAMVIVGMISVVIALFKF